MMEEVLFVKVGREVGCDVGLSAEDGCDVGVEEDLSVGLFLTQRQSLVSKWEPIFGEWYKKYWN